MKVSRAQAEENRERIVDASSELFREKGFEGIGLNDLMRAVGLTRGGFYGHFSSKQDLAVQACRKAFESNAAYWHRIQARGEADPLARLVNFYVSPAHRANPAQGCALAGLGVDVAREGGELQPAYAAGLEQLLGVLGGMVDGDTEAERRERVLALLPTLVGALVLARAVGENPLADEISAAAGAAALRLAGRPAGGPSTD